MGFLDDAMGFITNPLGGSSATNALTSSLADTPLGGFFGITQNKMAKEQFREQMDWSKYMFNNAHQAEVADLEKAGLNPILSYGGSGASSTSPSPTAHTDNGSAGLNFITSILGNVANLKNAKAAQTTANAVDKKATAEASFVDMQKRLLGYSEEYSKLKGMKAADYIRMELNKDPRNTIKAFAYGIGDFISELANSPTANAVERNTDGLQNFMQLFDNKQVKKVINTLSIPSRIKKDIGNFLNLIRVLTLDDSLSDTKFRDLKVYTGD